MWINGDILCERNICANNTEPACEIFRFLFKKNDHYSFFNAEMNVNFKKLFLNGFCLYNLVANDFSRLISLFSV